MTQTHKILILSAVLLTGIAGAIWYRSMAQKTFTETVSENSFVEAPPISDETPIKDALEQRSSITGISFNFAENANVALRMSTEPNLLSLFVTPQNIPLDVVEVRLKYDPAQTNISKISGAADFSDTTNSIFNNEEGWAVVYAVRNPESLIFDQETRVSQVEFTGTDTFTIVQNRSLAVSNNTLIELSIQ